VTVRISHPRLLSKNYFPDEPQTEDNVLDATYEVRVTVKKGSREKTFKATLSYGF
jgi:hypothetical protein